MAEILVWRVRDLKVGNHLDLSGDVFADIERGDVAFEAKYQRIADIRIDNEHCITIELESGREFWFPPDHYIRVACI